MRLTLPGSSQAESIYFGGGTPSLIKPEEVKGLLEEIEQLTGINSSAEITLEANPGTVSRERLKAVQEAGVNRLSLGIQSFCDSDLQVLGRIHSAGQAWDSIRDAQQAGFDNISLDFIFGLPGQTLNTWQQNLEEAAASGVQHLSLYSLIIEPGTPFERELQAGQLELPDEDLVADMFELAMDFLPMRGFHQYEISSWAKEETFESRHNQVYWRNQDYFGLGAGAHSKTGDYRLQNVSTIPAYIERLSQGGEPPMRFSPALAEKTFIDAKMAMQESMMLGLRMTREGISESRFRSVHQAEMKVVFSDEIGRILQSGLANLRTQADGPQLVLTRKGIMFGNKAFQEFV